MQNFTKKHRSSVWIWEKFNGLAPNILKLFLLRIYVPVCILRLNLKVKNCNSKEKKFSVKKVTPLSDLIRPSQRIRIRRNPDPDPQFRINWQLISLGCVYIFSQPKRAKYLHTTKSSILRQFFCLLFYIYMLHSYRM